MNSFPKSQHLQRSDTQNLILHEKWLYEPTNHLMLSFQMHFTASAQLRFDIPPDIHQLLCQTCFSGVYQLSAWVSWIYLQEQNSPTVGLRPLTNKRKLLLSFCYNEAVNAIIICGYVAENIIISAAAEKGLLLFTFNNLEINCSKKTVCFWKMNQTWKAPVNVCW